MSCSFQELNNGLTADDVVCLIVPLAYLGPYSPTILTSILCLFLQDLQIEIKHNFWLANGMV